MARTLKSCLLFLGLVLTAFPGVTAEPLRDDFEDGELTHPLQWQEIRPGATIESGKQGKRLLLKGDALVIVTAVPKATEYTIQFNGGVSWSSPCRFVFLYQDEENYYSFGIGAKSRGVYRKYNGKEVLLDSDALNKLALPHKGGITADYKVYINDNARKLTIQIDKAGDGVDYDTCLAESDPAIIARFRSGRFGFMGEKENQSGSFDNVILTLQRITDNSLQGVTYYIDAKKGDDKRSAKEAQQEATPWQSIQVAADIARAGDTIIIAPGTYHEMVVPANRGGADSPITFKALDPKNRPIVSGATFVNRGDWKKVEIADFKGRKHLVFKTSIDWNPAMVYQGDQRMMVAQHPNQSNALDPYELKLFMMVPKQLSKHTLQDPGFFVQPEKDYWKGADLLLWDSYPNAIGEFPITAHNPADNSIEVKPFRNDTIGNKEKERQDLYALRNHLGILDQPGEYYVDTSQTPHQIYVIPYAGQDPKEITAAARPSAFSFVKGREQIIVDGFITTSCTGDGISITGRNANHLTLRNIKSVFNMGSGIAGRFVNNITIEDSLLRDNHANGISFGNCSEMNILNCEITENGDNGIWFGGGQPSHWNSSGILIRGCYLHHATARRRHPDNYQMHQVRDITIENSTFLQEGEQNMWCQYSDNFTLRNNVFIGGSLGINSAMHSFIYHNVFWNSTLRYDRHLDNHPQNKDYYKPRKAIIRNNVLVDSSIAWPSPTLVDRFKVYTIDHNLYCMQNAHGRAAWEWQGRKLALKADTVLITDQEVSATGGSIQVKASVTWGNPGKLLFLYRSPDNYYWMGLGNAPGVFRRMNGEETCLFKDEKNELRLPHNGGTSADYHIALSQTAEGLVLDFVRTMGEIENKVKVVDPDAAAKERFTAGRFGMEAPPKKAYWCALSSVKIVSGEKVLNDGFADKDIAKATTPDELTWTVVRGGVTIKPVSGFGIGYGEGSIVIKDIKELSNIFKALPDKRGECADFHPAPGSPLINAGVDVNVTETLDEKPRPAAKEPAIGPYEGE